MKCEKHGDVLKSYTMEGRIKGGLYCPLCDTEIHKDHVLKYKRMAAKRRQTLTLRKLNEIAANILGD